MRRGSKLIRASGIPQSKLARYPRQTTMWTTSWSQMCGWSLAKCLGKKKHWKNMEKGNTFKYLRPFPVLSKKKCLCMFVLGVGDQSCWLEHFSSSHQCLWCEGLRFVSFFWGGGRGWRRQQEWSHDRQMERELACASRAFCESEMTRQRRHLEGIMGIMGGSVLVFILATISMRRLYNYQNDPSDPSVIFFNAQIVPFVTVRHPIWSNPMAFTPRVRSPLGLSRS